jgi:hypothetical protein
MKKGIPCILCILLLHYVDNENSFLWSSYIKPYGNKFFSDTISKVHMCWLKREKFQILNCNFLDIDYDDDDLECNLPLLEGAVLSATTSLNERGPENARLNGESLLSNFRKLYSKDRPRFSAVLAILRSPEIL